MRLFLILLSLTLLSSFTLAADPPAVDPLAESKRIDEEIRKLQDTPIAKQLRALSDRLTALREKAGKDQEPLEKELGAIYESEAWKQHQARIQELEELRNTKWQQERKAISDAAKRIYSARHEELRKAAPAAIPQVNQLGLDILTYPRIDGSTSTQPLNVILAARVLGVPYDWSYAEPTGRYWGNAPSIPGDLFVGGMKGGFGRGWSYEDAESMDLSIVASRAFAKPRDPADLRQQRTAVIINSLLAVNNTTHAAYVNVIEGKCDLNLTARPPSASEAKLAKDKGVELKLVPIARDALVFIVNHKNPVTGLSSDQLRAIYLEKTTRWKDVGGVPPKEGEDKILALWRERDSGSRELFEEHLMKGQLLPDPPEKHRPMLMSSGMGGPFSRLTSAENGLAYSVYYYEHFMSLSPYTKTIAIDGVEPTAETIASGKYPFVSQVYAVRRANQPADSPAMKMLAWLLSPEGQTVVRESGYIPVK